MASRTSKPDFKTLRAELLRKRSLFEDLEFPPDNRSLTYNGKSPTDLSIQRVVWKRPMDIVRNPQFVVSGTKRSDLMQGMLGDCWFVAAASLLVNGPSKQFERVVPLDQGFDPKIYAGIFHFNFSWYGKWVEVVIDDYLPTDGRNLIYCHNKNEPNEMWGALLEKAYAKLRGGCYEAIDGGKLQDALVDFTGGLSEVIDLTDKSRIPSDLYDLLWKSSQMNTEMGGSIHLPDDKVRGEIRRENGLYMGHAYSITALSVVPDVRKQARLLRLRNPWGHGEWNGPWSDKSTQVRTMSTEMKKQLNLVIEEEGEFWIEFEDFVANFNEIQLCHLQPDALHQELANNKLKQNWSVTVVHDAWIRGLTAGGCGNPPYQSLYWKNPQIRFEVKDPDENNKRGKCTVIISLTEKESGNKSQIAIGFDIYQIKNPQHRPLDQTIPKDLLVRRDTSGTYIFYREVCKRFEFAHGQYVIIPSTFNPQEEAEFMLRIYTEKEIDSEVLDEENKPAPLPSPREDFLSELFKQHAGSDGKMDANELKEFLTEATAKEFKEPIIFNHEACRSLVTMLDKEGTGFLNKDELKNAFAKISTFRMVFLQFDTNHDNAIDTMELQTMLGRLGLQVSRMVLSSVVRRYGGRERTLGLQDFIIVVCKLTSLFHIFQEQQKKTGGPDDVAQFTRNEFLQFTMFC
ncbi:hypothetical protein CHS0354_039225 [Potamilus streckersoni]|uniref:Uncharacterized protein n=1 Tax=Potamilus streckersoni TaxID=2493646 RepID=A0AAE0TE35_9BIVA|nr:hypothetical protein CHS0354_039225 [Potamilus streckersoni]